MKSKGLKEKEIVLLNSEGPVLKAKKADDGKNLCAFAYF